MKSVAFSVLAGLLICAAAFPARVFSGAADGATDDDTVMCGKLADFLEKEYRAYTVPLKDNASVRLFGLQEKDAMSKALALAIRLKAERTDSGDGDIRYMLPGGPGYFVIHPVYDGKDVFIKIVFHNSCGKLPFTELWLVGLKRFRLR
jgi:hypothetical protein